MYMVCKSFVDFNGVVVEKYDVTREKDPHTVEAEYGNQGADFKGVPKEGFGWVNASVVYALSFLPTQMKRALGTTTPWTLFHEKTAIKLDGFDDMTIHEVDEDAKDIKSTVAVFA
jgi:alpha,alpha-trehalase